MQESSSSFPRFNSSTVVQFFSASPLLYPLFNSVHSFIYYTVNIILKVLSIADCRSIRVTVVVVRSMIGIPVWTNFVHRFEIIKQYSFNVPLFHYCKTLPIKLLLRTPSDTKRPGAPSVRPLEIFSPNASNTAVNFYTNSLLIFQILKVIKANVKET